MMFPNTFSGGELEIEMGAVSEGVDHLLLENEDHVLSQRFIKIDFVSLGVIQIMLMLAIALTALD